MSIGKQSPPFRQRINIGSLHLRMTIQATHPVIQIVNRDEEYIGLSAVNESKIREQER